MRRCVLVAVALWVSPTVSCGRRASSATRRSDESKRPAGERRGGATAPVDTGDDPRFARIPEGRLVAGSTPGDPLRDAAVEMDDVPIDMEAFDIERQPRERRGISFEAAKAACAADGLRLCTELEWERACKGPENRRFASGDSWLDGRPSPFGVHAMGSVREWTDDWWGPTQENRDRGRSVRGGSTKAPQAYRRCAARQPLPPEGANDVGFRCCRGARNKAEVVMERTRRPFRKLVIPEERIAQIVRAVPELRAVHDEPHLFSDADVQSVLSRAGYHRNEPAALGWTVTWSPIMWVPRQGEQLLVIAGRGKAHAFVAALHRHRGDRYTHAASMILQNDTQPLAIGFGGDRRTIAWANCWGCTEGGFVFYEDDRTVRISHR